MTPFTYQRPTTVADAVAAAATPGAKLIAGGTNLIDLMKESVERPTALIDIGRLPLGAIEEADGGLRIGALVPNTTVAEDERVLARYPLLASAILAGATPQLRNAASTGGNLNQRTRCYYFYDVATPCNKRTPESGCGALRGVNRIHAILGTSDMCIATHPSDMCVALAALDAVVEVEGPEGGRAIPFADYHRLPEETPQRDNNLLPGEMVTAIRLPNEDFTAHHSYLKLRDRLSYAFALVSVAATLRIEDDRIVEARVALGGVAHKPWRDREAEAALIGKIPVRTMFEGFADTLLAPAAPRGGNAFKIPLARRAIVRALTQAAAGTPQSQTNKRIA
ncbi:xanthine dehydrogenase family protein subunit M [Sphingomonas naphthae]|uniref:Xanthine dehydrogenase family protein subunit M n=1 Tax=Sphingomonas naphthae TaxID=1813468 RepID=A0ABY7TKN7_9SPHN|nr:xanthine dehydrogenase family protein subunit M [Sphingomonas naphthae]WCT73803.1 xanthine dehydrogenase family protein subunit M [Sphingomonas naphthae]